MEIIDSISDLKKIKPGCTLTIGNFDGVHIGHQQILAAAGKIAGKKNNSLMVMTFEPHPVAVLHPEKAPGVLTPLPLKSALLEERGVDRLFVLKDNFELLNLSPEDFIDKFLADKIAPSTIVEGPDFNFGYGRSGDVNTLKKLGDEKGFETVVVKERQIKLSDGQNVTISSTLIRHMLQKANVADAAKALARLYRLIGRTIRGRGKGTHLGFPTANINPVNQIVPEEGVYAGFVQIGENLEQLCRVGKLRQAVFSIGRAKTFVTDHPLLVEAHLLEENVEDLYDKWLAMDFVDYIRSQQRFESEQKLASQIKEDCRKAEDILIRYNRTS